MIADFTDLRKVCVEEKFEVIVNNSFADRVYVSQSISSCLEWEETHQIYNLKYNDNMIYTSK